MLLRKFKPTFINIKNESENKKIYTKRTCYTEILSLIENLMHYHKQHLSVMKNETRFYAVGLKYTCVGMKVHSRFYKRSRSVIS